MRFLVYFLGNLRFFFFRFVLVRFGRIGVGILDGIDVFGFGVFVFFINGLLELFNCK